jgi:hypothetical protein
MKVLVVLFAWLLHFGGLGALCAGALSRWQGFVAWTLAVMFLFTASANFMILYENQGGSHQHGPEGVSEPEALGALDWVLELLGRWCS